MSRTFTSVNPARPEDVVGEFTCATVAEVSSTITTALAAQREWAARTPRQRAVLIGGVSHAISKETHRLAPLITREEGKTLAEAESEVAKTAEQFHFASQLCYLVEGSTYPSEQPGVFTYTLRAPLGVVVAITPWNFPVSLPARKLGAALAAGNSVVFKPSPVTAAVGALLVEIIREAGVPEGVVQLVQGDDPAAMATLVGHHDVRAISLTGSSRVGDAVRAQSHVHARLQSELSGHNAAVVCADADLAAAAKEVAKGAFGLSGQACTAAPRALVERPVLEEFTRLLADEVQQVVCGPGDQQGVTCGPVATAQQYERLQDLLQSARSAGARVVAEGRVAPDRDPQGYYITPTLLADAPAEHAVNTAEVFGPVLSLIGVDDLGEAIGIIQRDDYGLSTAIHTSNIGAAQRFAHEVPCGIIKINQRTTGNGIAPPFGGWKASSAGAFPEGGLQALDFFTDVKTVYSHA